MFELPSDEQRLAVMVQTERSSALARHDAKAVRGVQLVDAVEREQLLPGLARVRVKLQGPRADDRVVGHELRRL